ncbi:MAG: hypothetical protein QM788_17145 [Roseateles sp.]|uniref:hypothetical protein n=1 Tax=Roseateles sp. TaxID=1971397 RepID=UPI0039E9A3D5
MPARRSNAASGPQRQTSGHAALPTDVVISAWPTRCWSTSTFDEWQAVNCRI